MGGRLVLIAALGAALSYAGLLIHRNRPTALLVYRMVHGGGPPNGKTFLPPVVDQLREHGQLSRLVLVPISPKMGTTWVGHMVHQLVSHGAEPRRPLRNLIEDSPYPEFGPVLFGHRLEDGKVPYHLREPFASHPTGPVTIRTHTTCADLVKIGMGPEDGYRSLAVLRNPADTILSFSRFAPTMAGIDYETVPLEHFFNLLKAFGAISGMLEDYVCFWQKRHSPNLHLLLFEDLKANLEANVREMAEFLRIPDLTEEELQAVVGQSTHRSMSSDYWVDRFNMVPDSIGRSMRKKFAIPPDTKVYPDFSKQGGVVRKRGGRVGEGKEALPAEILRQLNELWAKRVAPRTGLATFEDMLKALQGERAEARQERQRKATAAIGE